ncbi:hypothetical protein VTN02DRAFT_6284 [Thermoascus thermophilus]
MARSSNVIPFYGRQDGTEDPSEYLEDIEFIIERDYSDETEERKQKNRRILFRQNLKGRAALWYSHLPARVKTDWDETQRLFNESYKIEEEDEAMERFKLRQRISALRQGPEETIDSYLERCEDLKVRLRDDTDFGLNVVHGLRDPQWQEMIRYDMSKARDYSYKLARNLIQAAYASYSLSSTHKQCL